MQDMQKNVRNKLSHFLLMSLFHLPRSQKMFNRKTKPVSYLFDMTHLSNYWGCDGKPARVWVCCTQLFIQFGEKKQIHFISPSCWFNSFQCILCFRYHHTGPVSGFFALRESLAIVAERVKYSFLVYCTYRSLESSHLTHCVTLSPSRGWRSPGGNTRRWLPTCTEG